jgi:hypothetical protein
MTSTPQAQDPCTDPSVFLKDAPQAHRVQRNGERDLSFQGWQLAQECVEGGKSVGVAGDRERKTCVSIFVTRAGKYVVEVWRAKRQADAFGSGYSEEIDVEAIVTEAPEEIVDFLKGSNRGSFGQASRDAWNVACDKYPPLAPHATETID